MIGFILVGALVSMTHATFDDMSDDDFAKFVQIHDDVRVKHGESAARGCTSGAIGAAPAGIPALCIGCALGAAGNVASDIMFPEKKK